jgi:hypothetical protein
MREIGRLTSSQPVELEVANYAAIPASDLVHQRGRGRETNFIFGLDFKSWRKSRDEYMATSWKRTC